MRNYVQEWSLLLTPSNRLITCHRNNLKILLPSKFKCNPPSLTAYNSLRGFPPIQKGLWVCKYFTRLSIHNWFKALFIVINLSPLRLKSNGVGRIAEIMISALDLAPTSVIKLLKEAMISSVVRDSMSLVPTWMMMCLNWVKSTAAYFGHTPKCCEMHVILSPGRRQQGPPADRPIKWDFREESIWVSCQFFTPSHYVARLKSDGTLMDNCRPSAWSDGMHGDCGGS